MARRVAPRFPALARFVSAATRVPRGRAVQIWMKRQLPLRKAPPGGAEPRFIVWPPIRSQQEYADIQARAQWLFPVPRASHPVIFAVEDEVADTRLAATDALVVTPCPKFRVELAVGPGAWQRALHGSHLLIWKFFDRRSIALLRRGLPGWIVDPRCYGSLEETEWFTLFLRYAGADVQRQLEQESGANLRRMQQEHPSVRCANVCGTGPLVERIYAERVDGAFNVVCNSGVQSPRLMDHLRPAAIAFLNSPYFGPSRYGNDFMRAAVRAVEKHGSYIVVQEGYPHYLLAANYPDIRQHIIGLGSAADFIVPTPARPQAKGGANVLTSLMIPATLAVAPQRIQVWGCDGFAPDQLRRSHWSYSVELKPDVRSAAAAHAAMFADYRATPASRLTMFHKHCHEVEECVAFMERIGVEVVCRSPSTIPALSARLRT